MQDRPSLFRSRRRSAFAVAALVVSGIVGSALAQDGDRQGRWKVQMLNPAELFGGTPENTEDGPPPPVHDPANPDHGRLQQPRESFSGLPGDTRGKPDWVRALREGLIQPRSSVTGNAPMPELDLDVLMKNTAQMPYVKFSHQVHTNWLACSNCHDGLFVPKAGANPTTMPKILLGESCGVCHTKVAFTAMFTCERCHSVPQPGQKAWW